MKKKWKKLWLAGILAAAFALGGCSGNDNASEAENAIQDGILTVGILAVDLSNMSRAIYYNYASHIGP